MFRTCLLTAGLLVATCASAQDKTPTHFDVITVKPHKASASNTSGWRWTSTGLELTNVELGRMISVSGRVQPWLVFGVPQWATSARWDISAKVTDAEMKPIETLTPPERMALIKSILTDRFGLVSHKETKVQPVFRMTVMPDGPKFKQSPPPPAGEPEPKFGRASIIMNNGVAEARNVTIYNFTDTLSGLVERTVIDNTNLTGDWDLNLKWQPEDRAKAADNADTSDAPPTLIEAVKGATRPEADSRQSTRTNSSRRQDPAAGGELTHDSTSGAERSDDLASFSCDCAVNGSHAFRCDCGQACAA